MNTRSPANHIFDRFLLDGKTVVITGGMGQLGTEYAKTLLDAGARVAVFDIDIEPLNEFYRARTGDPDLCCFEVDIADRHSVEMGCQSVIRQMGIPSVLINNAALDTPPGAAADENGPFENYPEKSLDQTYAVNLKGTIFCCQIIGKVMAENNGGSIINISSIYGNISPDQRLYQYRREDGEVFFKPVSYSVTKSAILNLTRYLATYWADSRVRVNTLSPGGVFNNQDERFIDAYCRKVPLARMANPDEYNGAVLFLASDASSYMTGANLVIDGGMSVW